MTPGRAIYEYRRPGDAARAVPWELLAPEDREFYEGMFTAGLEAFDTEIAVRFEGVIRRETDRAMAGKLAEVEQAVRTSERKRIAALLATVLVLDGAQTAPAEASAAPTVGAGS